MDTSWLATNWTAFYMILLSTACIYVTVIIFNRLTGLRSFSKMSGFDFVVTVAVGAVVAQTITAKSPSLIQAIIALGSLFFLQVMVAYLRRNLNGFMNYVDNQPILLMNGSHFIEENMDKARVTREDLLEKIRRENISRLEQVNAVIFETTGDVSVLHDNNEEQKIDQIVIENVKDAELLNQS